MGFAPFFADEKPFQAHRTVFKTVSEKMGAKFVRTTSTIYKRDERKLLPQHFTPCIVDVHPYKNISLAHYRVPRKSFKFVPVVPKVHGRANVCAHQKSIKPCNFQKCFGVFS